MDIFYFFPFQIGLLDAVYEIQFAIFYPFTKIHINTNHLLCQHNGTKSIIKIYKKGEFGFQRCPLWQFFYLSAK